MRPPSLTLKLLRAQLLSDQRSGGEGLTQEELAHRLGFHGATISRVLRQLQSSGELQVHRGHSPGHRYRVLVYRLVPSAQEPLEKAPAAPLPSLPDPEATFIGRTRELAQLRRGFARGGILVVDGVPGVGKTALVRRAIRSAPASRPTLWTTLHPSATPGDLWSALSGGAGPAGPSRPDPALRGPLEGPALPSAASVHPRLERLPRGLLWVVDDVHAASPPTLATLRELLAAFEPGSLRSAVLVSQRELPWPLPHPAATHLSLPGLSRRDAVVLALALGIPEKRFEQVYGETLGSPRYLRLSALEGLPQGASFADAALSILSTHQRRALVSLALAWGPLSLRSGLLPGLTPDEADALVNLSVLERNERGELSLPEPIASRLRETTPQEQLVDTHGLLATSPSLPLPERFCHWVAAERFDLAFRTLRAHLREVVACGDPRVQGALLRLQYALPPGRQRGAVLLANAELQRLSGDFVAASTSLQRALEQLPRDDPGAVEAAAALSLTTLRAGYVDHAERWAQAVAGLSSGHRWAAVAALARAHVLTYRRDFVGGDRLLAEAEQLALRHRQPEIRLMALHARAYAAFELKELDRSLEITRRGIALADRIGRADISRMMRVGLARSLSSQGREHEALEVYRSVLTEAEKVGATPQVVSALIGMARQTAIEGRTAEAERYQRRAVAEAERTQDRSIMAHALGALAHRLQERGAFVEAEPLARRAMALAREVGPSPSSEAVREVWERAKAVRGARRSGGRGRRGSDDRHQLPSTGPSTTTEGPELAAPRGRDRAHK